MAQYRELIDLSKALDRVYDFIPLHIYSGIVVKMSPNIYLGIFLGEQQFVLS